MERGINMSSGRKERRRVHRHKTKDFFLFKKMANFKKRKGTGSVWRLWPNSKSRLGGK